MSFIADIFGFGSDTPPPVSGPDRYEEFTSRFGELRDNRLTDLSKTKARMAGSGLKSGSAGWQQGLDTLESAYRKKLDALKGNAYFSDIQDKIGGLTFESDLSKPALGKSDIMLMAFQGVQQAMMGNTGSKETEWYGGDVTR